MHIRFAARDPGAANVLSAIICSWNFSENDTIDIWTQPKATSRFRETNFATQVYQFADNDDSKIVAREWQQSPRPDVLITGTSHYSPFDGVLWRLAKEEGIPSLAIVDYWSNLSERFATLRPDFIGVIDRFQADQALAIGFKEDNILTVGQPWLRQKALARLEGKPLLAIEGEIKTVLFVSERIQDDVTEGLIAQYGFSEVDSLLLLLRACKEAVACDMVKINIIIKSHPYENPILMREAVKRESIPQEIQISWVGGDVKIEPYILLADLVVGIASSPLLEAVIAGKPVLSLQPGLSRDNTFPLAQRGIGGCFTDPAVAKSAVRKHIVSADERARLHDEQEKFLEWLETDATNVVISWLKRVIVGGAT
jgi:hypothetical protein